MAIDIDRNMLRRVTPLVVVLALAVAAGTLVWRWRMTPEVTVATVGRGTAAEVVYATGTVEPRLWAKVVSLQRRRIIELCHCEGRTVRKGEVLARLDDVEERAVLSEIQARRSRLEEDVQRMRTLVERNVTSRQVFDEKVTQLREVEAREIAQKDRLADLELKAPMDGVVLRADGEVGEIAGTAATDVLFWIGQPKPLRIVAEVNEEDIIRVAKGQKVLLRHEGAAGRPLAATVAEITPKGDPQTKTFRVYLALPDDTPLAIGMSVEANVVVREAEGALLVPAEALSGNTALLVEAGERVKAVTVETGIRGTRMVEVRSGLAAGQQVVSPARAGLADGTRVRVIGGPRP